MPKNTPIPTYVIAVVAVGVLIALIGTVTFFSSRLVRDTVVDQFRSQELQLASSLAQQTETYINGLAADITSLALQPPVMSSAPTQDDAGRALMAEHGEARSGIIRSMILFDHRGSPVYAWPDALNNALAAGERSPYALPSRLVDQTKSGTYVPLDTELIAASRRDNPAGTFLLVTPVYNDVRKTDFLVYELNLDELFRQIMNFVELDSRGQVWVINSVNEVLYQANDAVPIASLQAKISLASVFSFREPSVVAYTVGGDDRIAVIAPIRTQGNDFVVILSRDTGVALEEVQSDLQTIFALAVGAILLIATLAMVIIRQLAREAQRRQDEVQRRQTARTLLEISRALNSTLNLKDVLRSIMAELSNILPYDSAAILLLDRSKLSVVAHRGADVAEHEANAEFEPEQALAANTVLQTGRPLVIHDTQADERWTAIDRDSAIRSWMGIPLRVRDKTVGVLNVNSHTVGHFSPEAIELAEAFADQASVALQNARLHDFEVTRIEQELAIAREIQTSLLPSAAPALDQLEIVTYTLPARRVSGDFFQYLPMPNGQLGIAVGDVSGKGIPAAILMAVITTAMRDEIGRNARPDALLNALNNRLLERMKAAHVNSALLVGVFDPPTRRLEIANGGMVQPYVRDGQAWSFVPVGGYPLGLSQRLAYEAKTLTLAPGAIMLIMTDGVVEAQNPAGEFFGFERIEALLNEIPPGITGQQLVDRIMAAVREHLKGEEPQDDLTILVIRSLETGQARRPESSAAQDAASDRPREPDPSAPPVSRQSPASAGPEKGDQT